MRAYMITNICVIELKFTWVAEAEVSKRPTTLFLLFQFRIYFIHNKVLFARSLMLTSTRCTISYQTHKNNMLSLDDIILNGNNTYARPRRIRRRHCCFVSSVFWRIGCSILAPHNTFVLLLHYQLDDSLHQKHIL